jgi:hypothetical protein
VADGQDAAVCVILRGHPARGSRQTRENINKEHHCNASAAQVTSLRQRECTLGAAAVS